MAGRAAFGLACARHEIFQRSLEKHHRFGETDEGEAAFAHRRAVTDHEHVFAGFPPACRIRSSAFNRSGCCGCQHTPRFAERSYGPAAIAVVNGCAAMASAFSTPFGLSICGKTMKSSSTSVRHDMY